MIHGAFDVSLVSIPQDSQSLLGTQAGSTIGGSPPGAVCYRCRHERHDSGGEFHVLSLFFPGSWQTNLPPTERFAPTAAEGRSDQNSLKSSSKGKAFLSEWAAASAGSLCGPRLGGAAVRKRAGAACPREATRLCSRVE